eukprot:9003403-Lingulodinium_polyedra.AAC.1
MERPCPSAARRAKPRSSCCSECFLGTPQPWAWQRCGPAQLPSVGMGHWLGAGHSVGTTAPRP